MARVSEALPHMVIKRQFCVQHNAQVFVRPDPRYGVAINLDFGVGRFGGQGLG